MKKNANGITDTTQITNTTQSTLRDQDFLEEAMMFGTTVAMERQEARGQQELVNSVELPRTMSPENPALWEALGFKFKPIDESRDDLFRGAELPPGWIKRRTDHSMWSDIVDDKGRVRGNIFYKAAFYDRKASMHLSCRFETKRLEGDRDGEYVVVDNATGEQLFSGGLHKPYEPGVKSASELCGEFMRNFPDAEKLKYTPWPT